MPLGTPHVLIRARASWVSNLDNVFAWAQFDALVTQPSELSADSIDMLSYQINYLRYVNPPPWLVARQGTILKVDDPRDTAAPGQGPFWIYPSNTPPDLGGLRNNDNPIEVFHFRLNLDGTPGQRIVDCVFRPVGTISGPFFGVWERTNGLWGVEPAIPQYSALTINVIPSGSSLALGVAAMAWTARRRRGA